MKNPIYAVIPVTPPGAGWWHLLPPSCQLLQYRRWEVCWWEVCL
jgi:hypothetical protein